MENNDFNTSNPKVVSLLSYITILGWIVAFLLNEPKSKLGSFHIRQALGVHLLWMASSYMAFFPFSSHSAMLFGSILASVLWLIGIVAAVRGEEKTVPILGEKFQEWFANL